MRSISSHSRYPKNPATRLKSTIVEWYVYYTILHVNCHVFHKMIHKIRNLSIVVCTKYIYFAFEVTLRVWAADVYMISYPVNATTFIESTNPCTAIAMWSIRHAKLRQIITYTCIMLPRTTKIHLRSIHFVHLLFNMMWSTMDTHGQINSSNDI